jgi:hypothetical protein
MRMMRVKKQAWGKGLGRLYEVWAVRREGGTSGVVEDGAMTQLTPK